MQNNNPKNLPTLSSRARRISYVIGISFFFIILSLSVWCVVDLTSYNAYFDALVHVFNRLDQVIEAAQVTVVKLTAFMGVLGGFVIAVKKFGND